MDFARTRIALPVQLTEEVLHVCIPDTRFCLPHHS
jgi:hypothetical protein